MSTVVYDSVGSPRVTLSKTGDTFDCILEVDGLEPDRDTTAEERAFGIRSLNPPTVRARTLRALIDAAVRAVQASATSTAGETGGPGGLLMTHYRVARAVRTALRLLDEDI
jgi:hypothetical protein